MMLLCKHEFMSFSDEDRILTENFYIFKGYGAKKLIKEFPNKIWGLQELHKLLKSCEKLPR